MNGLYGSFCELEDVQWLLWPLPDSILSWNCDHQKCLNTHSHIDLEEHISSVDTSQLDGGKETKPAAWPNSDTLFIKFNISGKHHLLRCHNIEKLDIIFLKKVDYFQRRGAIPSLDIALHEVRRPSTPFSTWLITFQW